MPNHWSRKTFECLDTLKLSERRIRDIAISKDGQFLAATDGDLHLWNLDSGELIWKTFGRGGQHITISPDGQYLAAGGQEFTAQLWSIATREHLRELKHNAYWEHDYECVVFTPDSRYLITGNEGLYHVWDVRTGEKLFFKNDIRLGEGVFRIAISPNGRLIVSSLSVIRLLQLPVQQPRNQAKEMSRVVGDVAITSDGTKCAAGLYDGRILLWDWESEQQLWQVGQEEPDIEIADSLVTSLSFSADGKVLASGSQDKAVRFWDVATGELLQAKEDFPRRVKKVVFRPDGETLVTGDAQQIQLWRLSS